jgi:poly-gamma-glutamate capsule biosynthesis protein CapA/YwtB (metallophosphatase superfamily)
VGATIRTNHAAMPRTTEAFILIAADWAPIRAFAPLVREKRGAIYGNLLPALRRADLRIVNCECALTSSTRSVWKSGAVFKGEPPHVNGLRAVPFEIACLANNHVLDYGVRGLKDTFRALDRSGIARVGAGLTEEEAHAPLSVSVRGIPVHIVNFSEGEDLTTARGGPGVFGWEIPRVLDLVRSLKREGGLVIAIGHCGLEYVPYPPPYVVEAFRQIADAGADCVVGHHPHVPQGIEWRGRCPIAYSLGNFVFYQETNLLYRKTGFCVCLRLRGARVAGLELVPYRITPAGLRTLDPPEDREFRADLARISRPFTTARGPLRAWEAYLAYYGPSGFVAEVNGILERMNNEPEKAAAMFRNRITTMQHAELWKDVLTRVMTGPARPVWSDAADAVEKWFTASTDGTAARPNR